MVWFAARTLSACPDPYVGRVKGAPLTVTFPPEAQPALVRSVAEYEFPNPSAWPSVVLLSGLIAVLLKHAARLAQVVPGVLATMNGYASSADTLPAGSVACTYRTCGPGARGVTETSA